MITDEREVAVRRSCSKVLDQVTPGTPDYERARGACIEMLRARRNQPGGYWIAKDDPSAAAEAVAGRLPLGDVTATALLSNGASRVFDPYGLARWRDMPGLLRNGGPDEIIGRVRRAELGHRGSSRSVTGKAADDASIAYCTDLPRAGEASLARRAGPDRPPSQE